MSELTAFGKLIAASAALAFRLARLIVVICAMPVWCLWMLGELLIIKSPSSWENFSWCLDVAMEKVDFSPYQSDAEAYFFSVWVAGAVSLCALLVALLKLGG
ncbi:hypothetical protein [Pontibacterium sp.]|uniref:hypothetical protein n=1 Tax=Pontibacterium sp. TaxID=2036026 RepID=UPI0035683E94